MGSHGVSHAVQFINLPALKITFAHPFDRTPQLK